MALLRCDFRSETLGMCMSMTVILPQGASGAADGQGRDCPCLLLLHGLSDDDTIWVRRTSVERYVSSLNLAVVMPNAHRSFYTDMVHGRPYWTYVSEEVPALARRLFRLSSKREDNFVAGLSMGGYGAFKLAMRCPDRYAAAASFSGSLDLASRIEQAAEPVRREFELVFGGVGNIRGTDNDLLACAGRAAARGDCPRLYQCCGTEDSLYEGNLRFRDQALRLGLPLTYEEESAGHDWAYWDRQIRRLLDWLPLRAATGGVRH